MSEDWQYTEEPVGDPHALCCSRCKADREALITTRQALTEIEDGTTPDRIGRYDALRDWVHGVASRALAATNPKPTLPLFESGNPELAQEADEFFSGKKGEQ